MRQGQGQRGPGHKQVGNSDFNPDTVVASREDNLETLGPATREVPCCFDDCLSKKKPAEAGRGWTLARILLSGAATGAAGRRGGGRCAVASRLAHKVFRAAEW